MSADYDLEILRDALGSRLLFFEELDSTNEKALELGRDKAVDGSVVLAQRQLAGRGRRGASWFCGEGAGLAFTLILRPDFARTLWSRLALVAGLAVSKSIESTQLLAEIKWPNDVLVAGRKVCGILVEAEDDFVVVGVGLNVGEFKFPENLEDLAGSLAEGGASQSREEHLLAIVEQMDWLRGLVEKDFIAIVSQIRSRCALSGKQIEFLSGVERTQGLCEGVGDGGELLVNQGGQVLKYTAADQIRVRA